MERYVKQILMELKKATINKKLFHFFSFMFNLFNILKLYYINNNCLHNNKTENFNIRLK